MTPIFPLSWGVLACVCGDDGGWGAEWEGRGTGERAHTEGNPQRAKEAGRNKRTIEREGDDGTRGTAGGVWEHAVEGVGLPPPPPPHSSWDQ